MTTAEDIAMPRIKLDEGFRANAYVDPISGGEPVTIGYGSTFHGLKLGTVWTDQQASDDLAKRVAGFAAQLDARLPWWRSIGPVRAAVLLNMAYNMGVDGLLQFKNTLADVHDGRFGSAALKLMQSKWAGQVHGRANRLAQQMRTGVAA